MRSVVFNEKWETGLAKVPDKAFYLAICDIPYGIDVAKMPFLRERNTTVKQKNGTLLNPNKNKVSHSKKEWDSVAPGQDYFDEVRRVSEHQIIFGVEYVQWQGLGPGRIKWLKGFSAKVSFKDYEMAYCSLVDGVVELPLLWAGMMQAKSLKEPMTQQGNKSLNEKRIHPCQKPVLLYEKLILDYAIPGCTILDTHLGSGSSRIAAHKHGCSFVGYESDEEYWRLGERRYAEYVSQPSIFSY